MNGRYVGYLAGHDPLHGFLSRIIRDCMGVREPQPGRIVTRDITQIISAGTVSELGLLEAKRANYLAAIYEHESASPEE